MFEPASANEDSSKSGVGGMQHERVNDRAKQNQRIKLTKTFNLKEMNLFVHKTIKYSQTFTLWKDKPLVTYHTPQ